MKKYLFFLVLFSVYCQGQNVVKGKVVDTNGEPLPFAKVFFQTQTVFVLSDLNGDFKIHSKHKLRQADTLQIRYIGFLPKKIGMEGQPTHLGEIVLEREDNLLAEVSVTAPPTVDEILDKMYENIPLNYSNETIQMEGFYRESMSEDGRFVELNESVVGINYRGYPIKGKKFAPIPTKQYSQNLRQFHFRFLRKEGTIFKYAEFVPAYHTDEDRLYLIEGRQSNNHSVYGNSTTPLGGPNDLLAQDKLKYSRDFLDPKNRKRYDFKYKGKQTKNGEVCYEIAFRVIPYGDMSFFQRFGSGGTRNGKRSFACYNGFLYVSVKDFALLSFKCQYMTIEEVVPGYTDRFGVPNLLTIETNYAKGKNGKYVLDNVKANQTTYETIDNKTVVYECERMLNVFPSTSNSIIGKREIQYLNDVSIRDYIDRYNLDFWAQYIKTEKYPELKAEVTNDLSEKRTLEEQFLDQNITIDEIEVPVVNNWSAKLNESHFNQGYFEQIKADYDEVLNSYVDLENDYCTSVFSKLNEHKLHFNLLFWGMMEEKEEKDTSTVDYLEYEGLKLQIKSDSAGEETIYNYDTGERIINLDKLEEGKVNLSLGEAHFCKDKFFALTYSEKGQVHNHLIIRSIEGDSLVIEKNYVKSYHWISDSLIAYTFCDSTYRPFQLRTINVYNGQEKLIYDLKDSTFSLSMQKHDSAILLSEKSRDESYIHEFQPSKGTFSTLLKKEKEVHKVIFYHQNDSVVYAEIGAQNRILLSTDHLTSGKGKELYQTSSAIEDLKLTKDFMVFTEYEKGSFAVKKIEKSTGKVSLLKDLPGYSYITLDSVEQGSNTIVISVQSAISPVKRSRVNLLTNQGEALGDNEVISEFNADNYHYEYLMVKTDGGVSVPATILYHYNYKDSIKGMLVNGYGAYGARNYPSFKPQDLIYANSGLCVVYVFPRGSSEKGLDWYHDGKLLKKQNSFDDFIGCTKALKEKYKLNSLQLIGRGGSAGGLLLAGVVNQEADLFGGVILDRPAIDVLGFMSNPSLPLTTGEYTEWGDVTDSVYYQYIQSYSPLQNIKKQDYPNLLVLGKYHDTNTPYWDIAKAVIKYRESATNNALILFSTDMEAGHFGNENFEVEVGYQADAYAFVMYVLDKAKKE
ncbi:MAG: prolyl oligopeptidase family serine peptidase [Flavobacteriales bacterium]|nr:prolyl oligopeptidase family serine peptidase [Flavobacteriales bacterium]